LTKHSSASHGLLWVIKCIYLFRKPMLLYHNLAFWRIVFNLEGSTFYQWRTLLLGCMLAAASSFCSYKLNDHSPMANAIVGKANNLGWSMMGGLIVFAVVFRTSLGWQRYWEAMTQLQFMYSKWTDSFAQCVSFIDVTIEHIQREGGEQADKKVADLKRTLQTIQRNFCLMSALAAHRLTHGDVQRMEKRCEMTKWKDQVINRQDLRVGEDLTGATQLPGFVEIVTRQTLGCENIDNTWFGDYTLPDLPSKEEVELLEEAADRVNVVMFWVTRALAEISPDLQIAPPIQSRMYQEISNGMLGFNNAVKIADVPFPFQFAQLFNLLVLSFSCFIPIYAAVSTESLILSPLIAFVSFEAIFVINKVAMELETPFGTAVNDISVKDFHARFLESALDLTSGLLDEAESMRADTPSNNQSDAQNAQQQVVQSVAVAPSSCEQSSCSAIAGLTPAGKVESPKYSIVAAAGVKADVSLPAHPKDSIAAQLSQLSLRIEQHLSNMANEMNTLSHITSNHIVQSAAIYVQSAIQNSDVGQLTLSDAGRETNSLPFGQRQMSGCILVGDKPKGIVNEQKRPSNVGPIPLVLGTSHGHTGVCDRSGTRHTL